MGNGVDDCISRQAALDAIHCDITVTGRQNAELVAATIGAFADRIKALPPVQSDVPDTNVGDMISKQAATTIPVMPKEHRHYQTNNLDDAYEQGWNDLQECIENLPPVQQKQTNCEYCHTDRDGYVFPLDKNSHAFIDRDKIVLKANGWRGEAKIKYCPICGRRLTDGTD